ncbi:Fe-S-binding ATPase [Candidatus Williamhamiltonella defendens]|uniref:Iron-sulfur cluster carrier protein n=2 Tax=Candidatus Williamhamiltonella defendens TaxID=138072 RepID=A0A2D3T6L8_9ENTR|nr:Fe-S-binding ATPase [Candidatus Hamiltonella defensa]ATW29456.1 Fe-S-binding ATPase [Candidatus Hamiltonella defensa]ATW31438.1 Fe-S-binding ATPase [Candidatus Hamiltonella defensa]
MNMKRYSNQNSAEMLKAQVSDIIATFTHPTLKKDLLSLNALHHCAFLDQVLHIEIIIPFAWASVFEQLKLKTTSTLLACTGAQAVDWKLIQHIRSLHRANGQVAVQGISNILAVSSGKGGVGKSCIAVNLALALIQEGAKVGILDADIYGPSVPHILGSADLRPTSPDGQHMAPIIIHGMASNSIGYLVTGDNAMVWRGPMASKALLQMLNDTLWPELDYLIVDMPPGTGDIQLTLAQKIPVTAAIVITTPQDLALIDAAKGIVMFSKVKVPILGVIENMTEHLCAQCGYVDPVFGRGGAEKLIKKYQIKLLGKIPLHSSLSEDADSGYPTVVRQPDSRLSDIFRQLASCVAAEMYWKISAIPDEIRVRHL